MSDYSIQYVHNMWLEADSPSSFLRLSYKLPKRQLVEAAITCAERVSQHLTKPNEEPCAMAIRAAKKWLLNGKIFVQCEKAFHIAKEIAEDAENAVEGHAANAAAYAAWTAYVDYKAGCGYGVYCAAGHAYAADHSGCAFKDEQVCDFLRSIIRWENVAFAQGVCSECWQPGEKSSRGVICLDCDKVTA